MLDSAPILTILSYSLYLPTRSFYFFDISLIFLLYELALLYWYSTHVASFHAFIYPLRYDVFLCLINFLLSSKVLHLFRLRLEICDSLACYLSYLHFTVWVAPVLQYSLLTSIHLYIKPIEEIMSTSLDYIILWRQLRIFFASSSTISSSVPTALISLYFLVWLFALFSICDYFSNIRIGINLINNVYSKIHLFFRITVSNKRFRQSVLTTVIINKQSILNYLLKIGVIKNIRNPWEDYKFTLLRNILNSELVFVLLTLVKNSSKEFRALDLKHSARSPFKHAEFVFAK